MRLAAALREALAGGYGWRDLGRDVLAGLVVGVVALPLSMALAIATGMPPQAGLYTAIVAGGLIAILGGSRVQVSGPTAAFVVVLVPIVSRHGAAGLAIATLMAGLLLVAMGFFRMGRLIQLIPYPVTVGFTAGIAVVIASLQVEDFLGLEPASRPDHFLPRIAELVLALPTISPAECALGLATLSVLALAPRWTRRMPGPLIALGVATLAAWLLETRTGFELETIRDRFSYPTAAGPRPGIPALPPLPLLPWGLPGPGGARLELDWPILRQLFTGALAIAMLGAIESLLSAVVADGMTGDRHDPDAELVAQGIGNLTAPFLGGFAATGAIARTATNVRAGARSPLAAVVHSLFVLAAVLALAPLLGFLPMAALAALLLYVAWNMSEARHLVLALRTSPRSDALVLATCFALTVSFDMVVAVGAGIVLASLLFMRRMTELSQVRIVEEHHPHAALDLPERVVYYEIAGPLFFGAAHRAMSALHRNHEGARAAILDLSHVPVIDSTGLVNLRSAIDRLRSDRLVILLTGVQPAVRRVLDRAGLVEVPGQIAFCATPREAIELAQRGAA